MPPPPTEVFSSRLFLGPALRAQPDRRLVTLVREGYEAAFEEIVRRYGRPLTRYAAAIVGSRSEDVTQDALSKALLALRRDDEKEIELRPWLYRIVRNTALNDLRDRPPTTEILEEAIAAGRGTAAEAEEREQLQELIERLRALPERQRAAIVMREFEGLSHEEIAAALGLSGGGARQVIFRAREALRSGAGMLLPLPLMRMLLEHGTEATTAGAGGAAGALAAGAAGGGAGAALKAGAVAAIIAGSVGTGIAIQHDHGKGDRRRRGDPEQRPGVRRRVRVADPAAGQRPLRLGLHGQTGDDHGGDRESRPGHDGDDHGGHRGAGTTPRADRARRPLGPRRRRDGRHPARRPRSRRLGQQRPGRWRRRPGAVAAATTARRRRPPRQRQLGLGQLRRAVAASGTTAAARRWRTAATTADAVAAAEADGGGDRQRATTAGLAAAAMTSPTAPTEPEPVIEGGEDGGGGGSVTAPGRDRAPVGVGLRLGNLRIPAPRAAAGATNPQP